MKTMNMPGFTAERSLSVSSSHQVTPARLIEAELSNNRIMNKIIPAVPMPYCKTVCAWRVCGSPLPGYPPPMCYSCEQECWIRDSGPYSRSWSSI
jgi:hypothetical protein